MGQQPQAPLQQAPQAQPLQQAPQQPGVNLQVVVPGQQAQTNPLAQLSAKYGQPAQPAAPAPAPQTQPLAVQPRAFAHGGLAVNPRRKARSKKGA
jgi:hypothetical protein